ncbi:MAG TPA: ATPase, T2SS/T4P/T4SS family, partial [Clostridia bacterium]|nr:ATPase, T2SS/T4P/T4SS family [Clostridia bacterium]
GEAPIIRLVNTIIVQAVEGRASDIHIEPMEHSVKVRYRIDGVLKEQMSLPSNSRSAIITRVKVLAQLNIAERRLPQDGRIKIKYQNRDIDLRISTIPVVFGEKVVIRILDKDSGLFKMDQLGFSKENLNTFRHMLGRPHGMLLITGPTGSGKTTTLYSALNEMDIPGKNIITIEDPVEYIIEGINQVQVNSKTGLTFATGLRSIIRQDPDIIMVGEIRDAETARIAVHAATTGHLVLSTLHTNDAKGAVTRLFDMGIEPYLAVASISGVIAQRLVRRLCTFCREPYTIAPDSQEGIFIGEVPDGNTTLYRAIGCDRCNGTGYWGRIGIQEILPITRELHPLFGEHNEPPVGVKKGTPDVGEASLKTDGIKKAFLGLTTLKEIMRICLEEG